MEGFVPPGWMPSSATIWRDWDMGSEKMATRTGGRAATTGVIPGRYSLSVGLPITRPVKGWKWTKLTDVARLETGHTPSRKHPEYWGGDIPWVGIRDATANYGQTIYKTNQYTNELGIANSSARILPPNTVCLSRTASVGYVIVMGREMATSQDFVNWVCDPKRLDHQFLKYILIAEKESFLSFSHGTTHQTIYFPEVKAFHVCLPSIQEQRAIAHILGSLDDKIALLRQMNETLEQMAQALFQSWFVDFDPVIDKALAAGNEIPEPLQARAARRKALGDKRKPLPAEIADLFPDAFTFHEEMGWVPDGWEVATIDKIAKVTGGGTPSTKIDEYFCEDGIPWLSPKDLSGYPWKFISRGAKDITQLGLEKSSAKLMPEGTVLFSSRAPIGYVAIAENQLTTNQGFKSLLPHSLEWRDYLYYYLSSNKEYIESISSGSTFKEVSGSVMKGISILQPPHGVLFCFADRIEPSNQRQKIVRHEVEALTTLRDTLLPKLISGEVEVGPFSNKISKNV